MDALPEDCLFLFDTVIQTVADQSTGQLHYRVELVDRYHDGPRVPSVLGQSRVYESLDEAITWARKAIEAFRGAAEGSS